MKIPSPIKCPICRNNMSLPDPRIIRTAPFFVKDSDTDEYNPPDYSSVRICIECGNVQQFIFDQSSN